MAGTGHTITLYTAQADPVAEAIRRDGTCFSKEAYVQKKYGESAPIFVTAYSFFVEKKKKRMERPEGAEYPYWAFHDSYNVDPSGGYGMLKLEVPLDQVLLFDVRDWNRILCLKYLGETEEEEREIQNQLAEQGLTETKIMLTNFYPEWKMRIKESWKRLFRLNEKLKAGQDVTKNGIQAGLWQIRREWITEGGGFHGEGA